MSPVLLEEAVAALAITTGWRSTSTRHSAAADTRGAILAAARPAAAAWSRSIAIPRPRRAARCWTRLALSFSAAHGFRSLPGVTRCLRHRASRRRAARPRHLFTADRRPRRVDSRCARTDRSTCAWIRRAESAPRSGSRTHRNVNSGEVIADYGEERFAQQIARAIVAARTERPDRPDAATGRDSWQSRRRARAG